MKLILAGGFLQIILANAWQINDSDKLKVNVEVTTTVKKKKGKEGKK